MARIRGIAGKTYAMRARGRGNHDGGIKPLSFDFTTGEMPPWLSFSRAGNAMMYDSTGKLTWAPNNQLTQSNNFADSSWVKTNATIAGGIDDPFGGLTASRVTATSGGGLTKTATLVAGTIALNSIYIRRVSGSGAIKLYQANGTAFANLFPTTSWVRYNSPPASSTGTYYSQILMAAGDVIDVAFAQMELVTYQTTPSAYNPTGAAAYFGPRFDYDPITLQPVGLLVEFGAQTNIVLWNRDLTNAVWVASSVTPAKDQVGIDGVANSASSITATAVNGTILQSITTASVARGQAAHIKRLTGTGAVQMTMDGGTTWATLTVTGSWVRYSIPKQTLANPQVGFRLATSGDAVAIDIVQNEFNNPTSPIITGGAAVTRANETVGLATGTDPINWVRSGNYSVVVDAKFLALSSRILGNSSPNTIMSVQSGVNKFSDFYTAIPVPAVGLNVTSPVDTWLTGARGGFSTGSAGRSGVMGGGAVVTNAAPAPPLSGITLGQGDSGGTFAWYRSFAIWPAKIPDAKLQTMTVAGAAYQ